MKIKNLFKKLAPLVLVFSIGLLIGSVFGILNMNFETFKIIDSVIKQKNDCYGENANLKDKIFKLERKLEDLETENDISFASHEELTKKKAEIEKRIKEIYERDRRIDQEIKILKQNSEE